MTAPSVQPAHSPPPGDDEWAAAPGELSFELRNRHVRSISLILALSGAVLVGAYAAFGFVPLVTLVLLVVLTLASAGLGLWSALHPGASAPGSLLAGLIVPAVCVFLVLDGGLGAPHAVVVPVAALVASTLASGRVFRALLGLILLTVVVVYALEQRGLLPAPLRTPDEADLFRAPLLLVMTLTATVLFESTKRYARALGISQRESELELSRARAKELELKAELLKGQKMEVLGKLAGGISHDFNNIFAGIMMLLELAREQLPEESDGPRGDLDQAIALVDRASSLTDRLLAFSRRQNLKLVPTDLAAVVRRSVDLIRRLIGDHVRVRLVEPGRVLGVQADEIQLEQALTHLALNARDAMPEGGVVTIEVDELASGHAGAAGDGACRSNHCVRITVTDTGKGMDSETCDRIFEPFFTTKGSGRGTGLGLAIVHGCIEQHGGEIGVSSTPGEGSRFEIHLPWRELPAVEIPPEPAGDAAGDRRVRGRVLVVDDEESVRTVFARLLRRRGLEVVEAEDGESALALARQSPGSIDLLLSDIMMPGMSGYDLALELRAEDEDLEVILVSGYSDPLPPAIEAKLPGVTRLGKPIAATDLLSAVQEALERSSRRAEAAKA